MFIRATLDLRRVSSLANSSALSLPNIHEWPGTQVSCTWLWRARNLLVINIRSYHIILFVLFSNFFKILDKRTETSIFSLLRDIFFLNERKTYDSVFGLRVSVTPGVHITLYLNRKEHASENLSTSTSFIYFTIIYLSACIQDISLRQLNIPIKIYKYVQCTHPFLDRIDDTNWHLMSFSSLQFSLLFLQSEKIGNCFGRC